MLRATSIRTRLILATGLALGALLPASSAVAGTDTANVAVSATVTANCTISSSGVSFGSYDPVDTHSAAALDATGTVTVTCTNGSAGAITLGQGANADTGSTDADPARRMTDGTNFLAYTLFQDAARTTEWGNTAATDVSHTGTGTATNITVYGRIPANQNVPAGSYTDTVVATVTF